MSSEKTASLGRAPPESFHELASALTAASERALASGDFSSVASSELASLITAALKLYAAKAEAEGIIPAPVLAEKITPTEVVVAVTEMLRAANISLFDLAMWYRRPR